MTGMEAIRDGKEMRSTRPIFDSDFLPPPVLPAPMSSAIHHSAARACDRRRAELGQGRSGGGGSQGLAVRTDCEVEECRLAAQRLRASADRLGRSRREAGTSRVQ